MPTADYIVIGAGIAGASVAYRLAAEGTVILLEREERPGYHTTGRSAAFFVPSYGGAPVRPLTLASEDFLHKPPAAFSERSFLTHRPAIHIAREEQVPVLERLHGELRDLAPGIRLLEAEELYAAAPMLAPGYAVRGLCEPECYDIDVGALHQCFLRGFRRRDGRLVTDAEITRAEYRGGVWHVDAGESYEAPVIVNAAGAWGDEIARRAGVDAVGLTPMRRTVIVFPAPEGDDVRAWPLVIDIGHSFYFKPESGRILASPADETPAPPSDVQPEEIDIAALVDRLEGATTLTVPRIDSRWAGLRTFAPDRSMVIGFDPQAPGFFWLAGQGGFGIQTAPAASELAAALAANAPVPDALAEFGIRAETYSPARFRE